MPEVESVKVMVRVRPINKREREQGNSQVVQTDVKSKQILISKPREKQDPKPFTFDYVFGQQSSQQLIYEQSAFNLVNNVLEGYNGTIFAYGQTGCGKTFTMMGNPNEEELRGIIPRTFRQIVTVTQTEVSKNYLVRCSFIEIYNEQIHDMLSNDNKAKMELRQSPTKGVYVENLVIHVVKSTQQMERYMDFGFKNRAVRETSMNKESSRSHSVFTIYIQSSEIDEKGTERFRGAKLNLVDLAGSQKQKKTNATGDGLKQAAKINLSLSALGNVISALVDGKFIPYRDSKLTRILQDSLGGNTKTIMIANISPSADSYQQSLSTLRYASRAKFIKNQPRINEDPKDALLREYAEQIKSLKLMLEGKIPLDGKNIDFSKQNKQNSSELQQQLRKKQLLLNNQKQQRTKIMQQLQALQQLTSHQAPSQASKVEMQKIKKLNQKLKLQKKRQQEYIVDKKRRQEDIMNIQKDYRSLNQQVDAMKQRFKIVKKQYLNSLTQLRDIQMQHQNQKEDLLDTVRYQQAQIKKYTSIINMMISSDEIDKISRICVWDEDKMQYKIPYFYLKNKSVIYPKMGPQQAQQYIDNQKAKKQLVFKDSIDYRNSTDAEIFKQIRKPSQKERSTDYQLNNIVKIAKQQSFHYQNSSSVNKSIMSGGQQSPLKNDRIRIEKQERTQGIRLTPIARTLEVDDRR